MDDEKTLNLLIEIKEDIAQVKEKLASYNEQVVSVKEEIAELKSGLSELKEKVRNLELKDVMGNDLKWKKLLSLLLAMLSGILISNAGSIVRVLIETLLKGGK